jgi:ElaB/YqjD/DUF883 family membrane-anchored ribosome-binding protein
MNDDRHSMQGGSSHGGTSSSSSGSPLSSSGSSMGKTGGSTGAPNGGSRPNGGSSGSHSRGGDMRHDVESSTHRLRDQTGRVVDDLRELGSVARDEAGNLLEHAKERGARAIEEGRERYDDYRVNIEQYVGEKPFTSLLIAAGAGVLLGLYMRGR